MTLKSKIIELRSHGNSYNQIVSILGCSKSLVSYHCGKGQKEKTKLRSQKNRTNKVICNKCWRFKNRKKKYVENNEVKSNNTKLLQHKSDDFQRERTSSSRGKHGEKNFKYKDVIKLHGINTNCYLTGRPINLRNPRSYEFDHIIPVSKNGSNNIDNLGICCKEANRIKSDMTVNELINLCKEILEYNGFSVIGNASRLATATGPNPVEP